MEDIQSLRIKLTHLYSIITLYKMYISGNVISCEPILTAVTHTHFPSLKISPPKVAGPETFQLIIVKVGHHFRVGSNMQVMKWAADLSFRTGFILSVALFEALLISSTLFFPPSVTTQPPSRPPSYLIGARFTA